jgi:hypothetical protein
LFDITDNKLDQQWYSEYTLVVYNIHQSFVDKTRLENLLHSTSKNCFRFDNCLSLIKRVIVYLFLKRNPSFWLSITPAMSTMNLVTSIFCLKSAKIYRELVNQPQ